MNTLLQIVLSLLPFHTNFPVDKIPPKFAESIYIDVINYKIYVGDNGKRMDDIIRYFIREKDGWEYSFSLANYVPGYLLMSDTMEIDYRAPYMYINYKDLEKLVSINKKVTSPFPMFLDSNELDNIKNEIYKDKNIVSDDVFMRRVNALERIKAEVEKNKTENK